MTRPIPRAVLAPNPSLMTLDGTWTYIVGRERPAVIDPGPADAAHVEAVLRALEGRRPAAIIVTHGHADHAGATAELAARAGGVVAAGAGSAARLIETDAGVLRIVHTPGHAPDHVAVHWTESGGLGGAVFVGDLLMGEGDTTLVAPPEGDLGQYLGSLERVEGLRAGVMYPAHGPPLDDPAAAIGRYRAHRHERLAQVTEALARAPGATPEELAGLVYGPSLPPALRRAAEGSIRAMLAYLGAEGGAVR